MRVFEEDGVIRRKQGIGTLICDTKNLIRSTLDINESVSEMILGKGMKPGSKDTRIEKIRANEELADKLNLKPNDSVISLSRSARQTGFRRPTPLISSLGRWCPKRFLKNLPYR